MPTRREIIARIETPLTALYGEREARQIARIVVMELGGLCLTDLVAEPDKELGIDELDRIIGELTAGRPLQYVLGHTEFYGLDFQVREGVLIPRPETEELVRWIAESPAPDNPAVLDVGTGSGCIAVTLARLIPESRITAVDISEKALSIARENARRLDAKVDFRQGDALGELFPGQREQFDLIVSNPPYIPRSEKASIRVNVTGYEPAEALFVEDGDPLIFYRAIARNARRLLRPGGRLYFEIHENFADETLRMLTREGFPDTAVRRDLNEDKTRQNARTGLCGLNPALCPERKILGRCPAADAALGRGAFGPAGRAAKAPRRPIHRRQPLRRSLRARQNPTERLGRPQDPHLAPAQRHRRSDHR